MSAEDVILVQRVLKCVKAGFSGLGDGVGDSFLQYLKLTKGIAPEQVVAQPEKFDQAVSEMFKEGAPYVQRLIVSAMVNEFGIRSSTERFSVALRLLQGR